MHYHVTVVLVASFGSCCSSGFAACLLCLQSVMLVTGVSIVNIYVAKVVRTLQAVKRQTAVVLLARLAGQEKIVTKRSVRQEKRNQTVPKVSTKCNLSNISCENVFSFSSQSL